MTLSVLIWSIFDLDLIASKRKKCRIRSNFIEVIDMITMLGLLFNRRWGRRRRITWHFREWMNERTKSVVDDPKKIIIIIISFLFLSFLLLDNQFWLVVMLIVKSLLSNEHEEEKIDANWSVVGRVFLSMLFFSILFDIEEKKQTQQQRNVRVYSICAEIFDDRHSINQNNSQREKNRAFVSLPDCLIEHHVWNYRICIDELLSADDKCDESKR